MRARLGDTFLVGADTQSRAFGRAAAQHRHAGFLFKCRHACRLLVSHSHAPFYRDEDAADDMSIYRDRRCRRFFTAVADCWRALLREQRAAASRRKSFLEAS